MLIFGYRNMEDVPSGVPTLSTMSTQMRMDTEVTSQAQLEEPLSV